MNGTGKGDRKENFGWGLSFGYPITRSWGVKVSYLSIRTLELVGFDSDTIAVGILLVIVTATWKLPPI